MSLSPRELKGVDTCEKSYKVVCNTVYMKSCRESGQEMNVDGIVQEDVKMCSLQNKW